MCMARTLNFMSTFLSDSKIGLIGVRSESGMSHAWFSLYRVVVFMFSIALGSRF